MSLLEEIKKLGELEQQATGGKWETEENDTGHEIRMGKAITCRGKYPCHQVIEYEHGCFEDDENDPPANAQAAEAEANACLISNLRNLAPAMIEVLSCFREGDAETLHLMKEILSHVKEDNIISIRLKHEQDISDYVDCLARSERAASLMEQDS